jgi:DNA-binding MarR family transcriptional regulator
MAEADELDPISWVHTRWSAQDLPEPERFTTAAALMRAHTILTGEIEQALKPHGLSLTAYLMLVTLALSDEGDRSLSYLARYLMVHQTTVTQLVDQCEQRGVIRRKPHPSDRRTTLAHLTRSGRALLRHATRDAAGIGFGMSGMSAARVSELGAAIEELRRSQGDTR